MAGDQGANRLDDTNFRLTLAFLAIAQLFAVVLDAWLFQASSWHAWMVAFFLLNSATLFAHSEGHRVAPLQIMMGKHQGSNVD
jgi:hypothetical protein